MQGPFHSMFMAKPASSYEPPAPAKSPEANLMAFVNSLPAAALAVANCYGG